LREWKEIEMLGDVIESPVKDLEDVDGGYETFYI